jgi:hypothetical protein
MISHAKRKENQAKKALKVETMRESRAAYQNNPLRSQFSSKPRGKIFESIQEWILIFVTIGIEAYPGAHKDRVTVNDVFAGVERMSIRNSREGEGRKIIYLLKMQMAKGFPFNF